MQLGLGQSVPLSATAAGSPVGLFMAGRQVRWEPALLKAQPLLAAAQAGSPCWCARSRL